MYKQKNNHTIEQIYKAKQSYKKLEVTKIILWIISLVGLVTVLLAFQNSILPYGLFVLIPVISGVLIHFIQLTKINMFANEVIEANHIIPIHIMMLNYMIIDSKTYRFQLIKSGVPSESYQLDHLEKIEILDDHKLELKTPQIKKKNIQTSLFEVKIKVETEKQDFALEGTKFGIQQLKRVIDQLKRQDLISTQFLAGTTDFD